MASRDIDLAVWNLHDAFLNASLVQKLMLNFPLDQEPETGHISDRFRLERLWVGLLAVLVEAWGSHQMQEARNFPSTDRLVTLVRQARKGEARKALSATRHYMFHRDKRNYWDEGRTACWGRVNFHTQLHEEFGKVILAGIKSLNQNQAAKGMAEEDAC